MIYNDTTDKFMIPYHQLLEEGIQHHRAGRLAQAEAAYRRVLEQVPAHPDALNLLGVLLQQSGHPDQALDLLRQALELKPREASIHNNLGHVLRQQGRPQEAIASFRTALACDPSLALACNNLGAALQETGDLPAAQQAYQRALTLDPAYAEAYYNFGTSLQEQGRWPEAAQAYLKALEYQSDLAQALHNLGSLMREQGQPQQALAFYQRALALLPDFWQVHCNLGSVYRDIGEMDQARAHYQQALALHPTDGMRLRQALLLPPIYQDLADLQHWRSQLEHQLAALQPQPLSIPDPLQEVPATAFYLAYQGYNDREILQQLAALYLRACPALAYAAPHCQAYGGPQGKIRLGFISRHLKQHTVGRLMQGLIQHLDRTRFAVTAFFVQTPADELAQAIAASCDRAVVLPYQLAAAHELIASEQLDMLFYPDIGMEPFTYFLAFARLAPVQCVTWGHPVTTGIPTIDYFLSSEDLETPASGPHYSETLVRMQELFPCSPLPIAGLGKQRADFGLADDLCLYICPQSLFKFHPDFDAVLGRILEQDPRGQLVLLEGEHPALKNVLVQRLERQWPGISARLVFLPRQSRPDFINLLALADVMLDPFPFGGGQTAYEGLAVNTPSVTWPGEFLRGRIASALYRQMALADCVATSAEHYVTLAVRLGKDVVFRKIVQGKIQTRKHRLFNNLRAVREMEAVLADLVTLKRSE